MDPTAATVLPGGTKSSTRTLTLDNASPATRLLEKRRQMFEVQEALEAQKQEFAKKEDTFRAREEALKRKDLELQESLIRFSRFLQDNDAKRARAEKKAADEIRLRLTKEKEVEQLTEVLEALREEKEGVTEVLDKFMRYQRYLEGVLEVADEYHEIGDLLLRHSTLLGTRQDLQEHQDTCAAAAESTRAELQVYTKSRLDEILLLNNRLAQLKKQLEGLQGEQGASEARKDHALAAAAQRTLEYGQVVMSTDNLYTRCRQRSYVPHPQETHPLKQLDAIGNYVSDLLVICKQQSRASGQGGAATAAAAAAGGGSSSTAAATAAGGSAGASMSGQQTAVAASD